MTPSSCRAPERRRRGRTAPPNHTRALLDLSTATSTRHDTPLLAILPLRRHPRRPASNLERPLESVRMPPIEPSPAVLALASHQPPPQTQPSASSSSAVRNALRHTQSLTAVLASGPSTASPAKVLASRKFLPKHAWPKRLWWKLVSDGGSGVERRRAARPDLAKQAERDRVALCGSWVKQGMRPSDLFLDVRPPPFLCLCCDVRPWGRQRGGRGRRALAARPRPERGGARRRSCG